MLSVHYKPIIKFACFVAIGLLIRLILMPISVHPDLFFINMFPNLFYSEGIIEIFSYINDNFKNGHVSYYTPLTYYSFVAFQFFYHLLSNSFSDWMNNIFEFYTGQTGMHYAGDYIAHIYNNHLFRDIFLAKVPYLIFETASLIILFKFIKSRYLKPEAILAWLFAPIIIYSTYIHGQYDIIPSFFVLLGFFLLKKKPYSSLISFGIAAAFKNYSLLFILIVSLVYGKTIAEKIKMILIGCVPYAILLIPILIIDPKLSIYSLFPKPYFQTSLQLSGWPLISRYLHMTILVFSQLLILIFALIVKTKDKWQTALSLSLIAITFVLTFAPLVVFQYLMWAFPVTFLWIRKAKMAYLFITAQTLAAASFMLLANHVQLGLFAPLNPAYFSSLTPFNKIIDKIIPYEIISFIGFFAFIIINLSLCTIVIVKILFQSKIDQ